MNDITLFSPVAKKCKQSKRWPVRASWPIYNTNINIFVGVEAFKCINGRHTAAN